MYVRAHVHTCTTLYTRSYIHLVAGHKVLIFGEDVEGARRMIKQNRYALAFVFRSRGVYVSREMTWEDVL